MAYVLRGIKEKVPVTRYNEEQRHPIFSIICMKLPRNVHLTSMDATYQAYKEL